MGTSLCPIANHTISFAGKTYEEMIASIKPRLDSIVPVNRPFLLDFACRWYEANEFRTDAEWLPLREDPRYYEYDKTECIHKAIDFEGYYNLWVSLEPGRLHAFGPPYRYWQWFGMQNEDGTEATEWRNEWRTYPRQVVHALGGDRVIYLADNAHPLEKYLYSTESAESVEQLLRQEYGPPAATFREVHERADTRYFVDYFTDLQPAYKA